MVRNIILALATLAILIVLLLGYGAFFGSSAGTRDRAPDLAQLPAQAEKDVPAFSLGQDAELPGGGKIVFRPFDEHTGRPTGMFSCRDWQPVPGSENDIFVHGPELAMVMPSGMVANIRADEGQLTGDRVERAQMRPRAGWLTGDVRIVIDSRTSEPRTPHAERPEDLITIRMDRLEFDLEKGEMRTQDRVRVEGPEFAVSGTGLELVWNQADNRVETLSITRGEEFVFYAPTGLFGAVGGEPARESEAPGEPSAAATARNDPGPSASQPDRSLRSAGRRGRTLSAYTCALSGDVRAEQYQPGPAGTPELVGGLTADEISLLFDVGSGAGRLLRPSSRPAAAAEPENVGRLVVRWSGPLRLGPAGATPENVRRLHFAARGNPVVLTRGTRAVRCGRVQYHEETQRIWLDPPADGPVELALGESMSAAAGAIYVDRAAQKVKLVGPVELRSRRGGAAGRISSIRASSWGELRLPADNPATRPVEGPGLEFDRLESATFVGDVEVALAEQRLDAHRLDVRFHGDGATSLEEAIDTAVATGGVRLDGGDGRVTAGKLELTFALTPQRRPYPRHMEARGDVELARDTVRVRGAHVLADLDPRSATARDGGDDFVLQTLDVRGDAELIDPGHKRAARGEVLHAEFAGRNELTRATVTGTPERHGLVHARPYTVRGERIELAVAEQTLHVDGPNRLSFRTTVSLQGRAQDEAVPMVVTSRDSLHIDGQRDTVVLSGEVLATSAEERLAADRLTLLLAEVPRPARPARGASYEDLWREAQRMVGLEARSERPAFEGAGDEFQPKRPVRLIAENATVSSESFVAGDEQPVLHADISAPVLEVDIDARQIFTTGLTQLLMTDRRGLAEEEPAQAALGLPSALITRGPSQTAMQCEGRMIYTFGPEGPARRDTVVFEDEVLFVHRAGREMINLAQMLPEVAADPAALAALRGRNVGLECKRLECWFSVDEQNPAPQRGGGLTSAPLRLASLLASGSVWLRDEQEELVREVYADWMDFNRELKRIHVRGPDGGTARIYLENKAANRSDRPYIGRDLVVDLRDGTVRTGEMAGELRRK